MALILDGGDFRDKSHGSAGEIQGMILMKCGDGTSHGGGGTSLPGFTVESLDIIP